MRTVLLEYATFRLPDCGLLNDGQPQNQKATFAGYAALAIISYAAVAITYYTATLV